MVTTEREDVSYINGDYMDIYACIHTVACNDLWRPVWVVGLDPLEQLHLVGAAAAAAVYHQHVHTGLDQLLTASFAVSWFTAAPTINCLAES